jgi:large subunit ribosomal protein L25
MPEITLHAETGRPLGSRSANRLRSSGKIPGVLYGHGTDPLPIAVDARSLRSALSGDAGLNALLSLDLDGGASQLAMAKDIQRHPTRGTVSHVDFILVNRDEVITADVPVLLVGDAAAVHRGDGVVEQSLFSLTVHAKPGDLPNQIEVDVSDMEIGDAIRVDDLDLPAGVHTDQDGETAIAVAQPPQAAEGAAEGEEGAEGVELGEGVAPGAAAEAGQQSGAEPPARAGDSDAGDSSPDAG